MCSEAVEHIKHIVVGCAVRQAVEHIKHIVLGCTTVATSEYASRYDQVDG